MCVTDVSWCDSAITAKEDRGTSLWSHVNFNYVILFFVYTDTHSYTPKITPLDKRQPCPSNSSCRVRPPPLSPFLLLDEYSSNSRRGCQPYFFFSSCRSRFPECFLGALELQWHCRSRVRVAETRCRSSLGEISRSISAVSSQICAHFELLEVADFEAALMNTQEEFANAKFCLDVRSSAMLGIRRTSSGQL